MDIPFEEISRRTDELMAQAQELELAIHRRKYRPKPHPEYFDEDCVEIAAAVKSTIRSTGMSRPELVDAINRHYGWPTVAEVEEMAERPADHLSLHIFNHYLSKPTEYRMPAGLLLAIVRITGSLEPCRVIAEAVDGGVVEMDEKAELLAGKAERLELTIKKLNKKIKDDWRR